GSGLLRPCGLRTRRSDRSTHLPHPVPHGRLIHADRRRVDRPPLRRAGRRPRPILATRVRPPPGGAARRGAGAATRPHRPPRWRDVRGPPWTLAPRGAPLPPRHAPTPADLPYVPRLCRARAGPEPRATALALAAPADRKSTR